MTSTLRKNALFAPGDPGTPDSFIDRQYVTTRRVPRYQYVPVFSRSEADLIKYPKVNAPQVLVGGNANGYIYLHNWFKRVIAGYEDESSIKTETILIPGRPPGAPTPLPDAWDATAWSIESFPDPMAATFIVGPGPITALHAGLTYREVIGGEGRTNIVHGFKVEGGYAYAMTAPQPGVPAAPGDVEQLAPALPAPPGTELRIEAVGGRVRYMVGGQTMAVHPSRLGQLPVRLAAALYSVKDTILDPTIEALDSVGSGTLQLTLVAQGGIADAGKLRFRLQAVGGHADAGAAFRLFAQGTDGSPGTGGAKLRIPAASGFGYVDVDGTGTAKLYRFVAAGSDYGYAGGSARLLMAILARSEEPDAGLVSYLAGDFQLLEATASFPHAGMTARALVSMSFDGAISPGVPLRATSRMRMDLKGSLSLAESFVTKGSLGDGMAGQVVRDVAFVSAAGVGAPVGALLVVTAALTTVGAATVALSAVRSSDATLEMQVAGDWHTGSSQILTAALEALGHIGAEIGTPGETRMVWSINAETGASAAYEDYPFNSFATIGGRHFGAASDGIYELVGDDDAGVPIQAHLNLGKRNFGTSKLKAMPYAYLGVASDGLMVVRVTTEDASYTYKARAASAEMQTQRVDFGRGLRANYFTLELMNEGGADFDLDVIELAATPLTRRI